MSRLVIVGARAMGRETCTYAQDLGMEVKGFLDDDANALKGFNGYPKILSSVEDYHVQKDDAFVIALGDSALRRKYSISIMSKGGVFTNVVHPSTYLGKNVRIGHGCIICPNSIITNDCIIGNHVILNANTSINHDNRIGDYVTICPGVHIAGRVTIGTNTFIGTGVTIIPDVVLGSEVFVAAGAVVTRSFSSGRLMGVPAVKK